MLKIQHTMLEENDFETLGLNPEDFENYMYCDAFVHVEKSLFLGDFHENDGDWRDEYFNDIFKAVGVEINPVNLSSADDATKDVWKKALKESLSK